LDQKNLKYKKNKYKINNLLIHFQVRNICVQAIGRLVYLFSSAKFTEQFPRLIQNVLGFYRKNVDHLYVSETLNSVVLLAHQWNVPQLKLSIDLILKDVLNEVK
jgi:hypothetical protein